MVWKMYGFETAMRSAALDMIPSNAERKKEGPRPPGKKMS
jgi:hypothetical protein